MLCNSSKTECFLMPGILKLKTIRTLKLPAWQVTVLPASARGCPTGFWVNTCSFLTSLLYSHVLPQRQENISTTAAEITVYSLS